MATTINTAQLTKINEDIANYVSRIRQLEAENALMLDLLKDVAIRVAIESGKCPLCKTFVRHADWCQYPKIAAFLLAKIDADTAHAPKSLSSPSHYLGPHKYL